MADLYRYGLFGIEDWTLFQVSCVLKTSRHHHLFPLTYYILANGCERDMGGGGGFIQIFRVKIRAHFDACIFSSPEHQVLMVSYCDQSVRRPCIVNFLL